LTIFRRRRICLWHDKFFYELIITHFSKFFKKNELEKFTALAANSFMKIHEFKIRKRKEPQAELNSARGSVASH